MKLSLESLDREVEVWQADLDLDPGELSRAALLLSGDEKARADRFHFERDRRRYIAARGRLRILLGGYLDHDPAQLQFAYGMYGKPELANPIVSRPLHFNLSHSGGSALFAFTLLGEVGVDLERVPEDFPVEEVARHYFTLAEATILSLLPAAERRERFAVYWTRKEAYIKARGLGLSLDPTRIEATSPADRSDHPFKIKVDATIDRTFSVWDLEVSGGYAGALAVAGDSAGVRMKDFRRMN